MKRNKHFPLLILIAGLLTGAAAVLLSALGNPRSMGFCIACFLRDTAGALHLHSAEAVQYLRPEIPGLILGSAVLSLATGEFRAKAGASPILRFLLGAMVMVGALVFLGCPLRMVIRMGGGDLNAYVGFAGFVLGICLGILFLKKGFDLGRAYETPKADGLAFPVCALVLLALFAAIPVLFARSEKGPGSMHAPLLVAFGVSLVLGALAQRTRLCMVGGMRDAFLFRDFHLLLGFAGIFAAVLVGNLITKNLKFSFTDQPVAHSAHLWNLLGMTIVGWGSTLLGGCPLRQLILAGEGNGDSAVTVLGMLTGAAISHNFSLAGAADSLAEDGAYVVGGPKPAGKIAVVAILVILAVISFAGCRKGKEAAR